LHHWKFMAVVLGFDLNGNVHLDYFVSGFSLVAVWILSFTFALRFWNCLLSLVLCLSLLKYCHGNFWFKSQDIYLIVLAAVLERLSPRFDLSFFILWKREIDSRRLRYFAVASLFIPSYWKSQVICWRFQWRCFRWADSDFTHLQKYLRRQK
jgi:hypothetical protein